MPGALGRKGGWLDVRAGKGPMFTRSTESGGRRYRGCVYRRDAVPGETRVLTGKHKLGSAPRQSQPKEWI